MDQDDSEVRLLPGENEPQPLKKSTSPLWQVWKLITLLIIFAIISIWIVFTMFPSIEASSRESFNEGTKKAVLTNCSVLPTNTTYKWRGFEEIVPGTLVYSAYYDDTRTKAYVRIIAISETFRPPKIFCHSRCDSTKTHDATFRLVESHKNRRHAAFIISCEIPRGLGRDPSFVSLSAEYDYKRSRIFSFPIHSTANKHHINNYTVCVPPLFGSEISSTNFTEFIEMNRILGASKFVIYNETIHKELAKVVNYYESQGVVMVMPWKLPHYLNDFSAIHYHGQLVSIQDCLYRNRGKTKWLGFHDLDEFLVPLKQPTVPSLLKTVYNYQASGYCIQSILLPRNNVITADDSTLITQRFVLRTRKIFKKRKRSKCIVDPRKVFEMGIHYINKPVYDNYLETWISPKKALVFHYRQCVKFQDLKEACSDLKTDGFMLKYKKKLLGKVNHVLRVIKSREQSRAKRNHVTSE